MIALVCLGSLCVMLAFPAPPPQAQGLSPSFIPVLPRFWIPQGPAPVENAVVLASPNNEADGAIETAAAHPTNADIIYVGTVNGGIWKTINGTSDSPTWRPLTDDQKSLSIGALKFDPTDRTSNTLIAGIGRFSSFGGVGGPRTGLLRTIDGGSTWTTIDGGGTLTGTNISGVAARGSTILAASNKADNLVCKNVGLFRSTDDGKSFGLLSGSAGTGLSGGRVFDLTEDPNNAAVLYAPVLYGSPCTSGGASGVYKSNDDGATWSLVSNATINALFTDKTVNSKIAVGANNNVYVGIVNNGVLAGLFHSTDGGATWTALDVPDTNPGSSGAIHFSIVADAKNPAVVYVAGDAGDQFRLDSTKARGRQAEPLSLIGTAHDTLPHVDSRGMVFDANGNLLEVDDGGIYRRTSPENKTGDWYSIVGNLQVTELDVVAYDRNSRIIFGGAQDIGALIQASTGSARWIDGIGGDGGDVEVDVTSRAPNSIRYLSRQFLGDFRRATYNPSNDLLDMVKPSLTVIGGGAQLLPAFVTPVKVNEIDPLRIVLGGRNAVYESADQGDTITELKPSIRTNNPGTIVYGGRGGARLNFKPNADLLYVGSFNALYKRTAPLPAELIQLTAYPGTATITGVTINPRDYDEVWVTDASNVYRSIDGGASWSNVTRDLATFDVGTIQSIEWFGDEPVAGTNAGVFEAFPGQFDPLHFYWYRLGKRPA
jgi:photosystem II stability/assembly factor-like uncharacterized protein